MNVLDIKLLVITFQVVLPFGMHVTSNGHVFTTSTLRRTVYHYRYSPFLSFHFLKSCSAHICLWYWLSFWPLSLQPPISIKSWTVRRVLLLHWRRDRLLTFVITVHKSASDRDIRAAYKRLSKKFHPDKNKDPDAEGKFVEIARGEPERECTHSSVCK